MEWDPVGKIEELRQTGMTHLVVREGSKIVCFASVLACTEDDLDDNPRPVIYIYEFHVCPEFQKQGVGTWFLQQVLLKLPLEPEFRHCTQFMLTVQTGNEAACSFYRKHGFRPDEVCPSQCLEPEEASELGYLILSKPVVI